MARNGPVGSDRPGSLHCIVCGNPGVEAFLDLGATALANKFLTAEELSLPEPTYPLTVGFCHRCDHVQLTDHVPPGLMFEDYLYISSASETLRDHLYGLSDLIVDRYRLGPESLVIDVGCNDGTLLKGFRRYRVRVLGVDPARNLAQSDGGGPIDRCVAFFGARTAPDIVRTWGRAAVITATNTFPHIPDLDDFVEGIKIALAPGGTFVIEAHYLVDLLDRMAFDTIYHEHVSYWALGPMVTLFEKHGMKVVDVQRLPVHHGQLRVFVRRTEEGAVEPSVDKVLEEERARGLYRFETYLGFAERIRQIKDDLGRTLRGLRTGGKRVVGYGAPAKANTLLAFLGLGPDVLEYIADRSPLKQGRYTPGLRIPVVSPERLLLDQPDYVVLLAWNFAEEILDQQQEYRRRGGKFIVPLPEVKILP